MQKVHTPEIDHLIETFDQTPEAFDLKVKTIVQELKLVKTSLTLAAYQVKEAKRKSEAQSKAITNLIDRVRGQKKHLASIA